MSPAHQANRSASARELLQILDKPDRGMGRDFNRLGRAYEQVTAADGELGLSRRGVDAATSVAQRFGKVADRMAAIDTSDPARDELVAAFGALQQAFDTMAASFNTQVTADGNDAIQTAAAAVVDAQHQIARVRRDLEG